MKKKTDLSVVILVPYYFSECKWGEAMFAEHLRDSFAKRKEVLSVVIVSYENLDILYEKDPDLVISLSAWRHRPKLKKEARLIFWIFNFAVEYSRRYMSVADAILYNPDAYATNSRILAERLAEYRPTILLHLAANPDKHQPVPPVEKYKNEVIYVGSYNVFTKSAEAFERYIRPATEFNLALYGEFWLSAPPVFQKHYQGLLPNNDLSLAYSSCKIAIGFNARNQTYWEMINDRTFWTICSGILFISDRVPELERILPGGCVITDGYSDSAEKIRYYLDNETERLKIINKGREIVLKCHTYDQRVEDLIKLYWEIS